MRGGHAVVIDSQRRKHKVADAACAREGSEELGGNWCGRRAGQTRCVVAEYEDPGC